VRARDLASTSKGDLTLSEARVDAGPIQNSFDTGAWRERRRCAERVASRLYEDQGVERSSLNSFDRDGRASRRRADPVASRRSEECVWLPMPGGRRAT